MCVFVERLSKLSLPVLMHFKHLSISSQIHINGYDTLVLFLLVNSHRRDHGDM